MEGRYGLIGSNGCGKSLLMGVLGRRLLPIPDNIDSFHVTHEVCAAAMGRPNQMLHIVFRAVRALVLSVCRGG